jgi:D-3-phosphoglycerate dehydrogenase
MRILLTTTSFQDTPGPHHETLGSSEHEIVRARGPLGEDELQRLFQSEGEGGPGFDGIINGDDALTGRVIDQALPRLKVISKYGIGLDSIDVSHASERGLPVLYTPGVNHTTVAEHTIGLMIAGAKQFWPHMRDVKDGAWKRRTGSELAGKTLAVLGMGRIGRELIKRARAFSMETVAFDVKWDEQFASEYGVQRYESAEAALTAGDVVSLHMPATEETHHFVNQTRLSQVKDGAIIINTARGNLVEESAIAEACRSGKLAAYAADVLEHEPIQPPHPFQEIDNILITPHIASRTTESVQRQAMRATRNLLNFLAGDTDYVQANETPE